MLSNAEQELLREYIASQVPAITSGFLKDIASSDSVAREILTTYKAKLLQENIDKKANAESEIARLDAIVIGE